MPSHFFGLASLMSEPTAMAGRVMRFERLVASSLVREESFGGQSGVPLAGAHRPSAPYLRLVVSQ
jgi:hypothetical protein